MLRCFDLEGLYSLKEAEIGEKARRSLLLTERVFKRGTCFREGKKERQKGVWLSCARCSLWKGAHGPRSG